MQKNWLEIIINMRVISLGMIGRVIMVHYAHKIHISLLCFDILKSLVSIIIPKTADFHKKTLLNLAVLPGFAMMILISQNAIAVLDMINRIERLQYFITQ